MSYKHRNGYLSNIVIDGENYTKYFTFPFTVQNTLDESLDSAMIQLSNMKRKEPFKPFTDAELGTDADGRIDMLVANDEVTEVFGRGLYNHQITLIEPTKLLERYVMSAKAFTNHTVRNYENGGENATVQVNEYYIAYKHIGIRDFDEVPDTYQTFKTNQYFTLLPESEKFHIPPLKDVYDSVKIKNIEYLGELHFLSAFEVYIYFSKEGPDDPYDISNMVRIYAFESEDPNTDIDKKNIMVDLDSLLNAPLSPYMQKQGYYVVEYKVIHRNFVLIGDTEDMVVDSTMMQYEQRIKISTRIVAPASDDASTYTMQNVLWDLALVMEPLKEGEPWRFSYEFTDPQLKMVENTKAPEFKFPAGRTFWENIREAVKFLHWMPRLVRSREKNAESKYAVRFDELGGNEYADLSKGERISGGAGLSVADYADALEANVSNLLNADDELEGSIITPCANLGITIRSDNARIAENDSYIPTPYPIEKLLKLEAFATIDGENKTIDLTPYVFEKTEYDTLSSFSGAFPHSKTYALYYTQGSRNIDGLWYRVEDGATTWENSRKRYAITNIFNAINGTNYSSLGYHSITYRVTYVPTITARARQFKTDRTGRGENGALTLPYNQSANKLAARAFGENMRGQIAMLGNKTRKAMYLFGSYPHNIKPGMLFDDKNYISTITTRVHPDFCVSEIGLSEGYNELGGYLELNNAYRQFEIPGESERHFHIDELCVISSTPQDLEGFAADINVMKYIMQTFTGQVNGVTDISLALATTYSYANKPLETFALPVVSTSIGNSLYFGFRYEDNFSAGSSATGEGINETTKVLYKYTQYEPYGDAFARAKYLEFTLHNGNQSAKNNSWLEQGHAFPKTNYLNSSVPAVISVPKMNWCKDAADGGDVSYQLHFVTDSGFIIGDALARQCPLVRSKPSTEKAKIHFYDHRINELTGYSGIFNNDGWLGEFDLDISELTGTITVTGENVPNRPFKAWKIVRDGECLIGCNSDTVPKKIYFGFKRP